MPESPAARWKLGTAFLDRDGTINEKPLEGDYIKSREELRLLSGAAEAVHALHDAGLRVVVVTNQRGIALGRMSEDDLEDVHRAMLEQLGDWIDAIYHCPHALASCGCRKPRPGMLHAAREREGEIDFRRSVMVGDSASDMQTGRAVGCRLLMLGDPGDERVDFAAPSLSAATEWLLTEQ